jgi:hypothetical protein
LSASEHLEYFRLDFFVFVFHFLLAPSNANRQTTRNIIAGQVLDLIGNNIRADGYERVRRMPALRRLTVSVPDEGRADALVEARLHSALLAAGFLASDISPRPETAGVPGIWSPTPLFFF